LITQLTGANAPVSGGPAGTPWAPLPKAPLNSPDPVDPTLGGLVK
jgi:phospholipid/cholesterol/gamma-HCH transport system substrate-binding protein